MDVVICTISGEVIDLQRIIIEAAKEAGVQLFLPSEFGGATEGETEGVFGEKADIQRLLVDLDLPYAAFYTGPFADYLWASSVSYHFCPAVRRVDPIPGTYTLMSQAGMSPLEAMAIRGSRLPLEPT
jgi:NmrA-like family